MGDGYHAFVARTDCAAAATFTTSQALLADAKQYVALVEEFGGRQVVRGDVDDAK